MKGINFNTQEVKAILEGRKTVTRRVVKPQPKIIMQDKSNRLPMAFWIDNQKWIKPPYQKDDILYVKETWCSVTRLNDCEGKHSNFCGGIDSWEYYKADEDELPDGFKWHPSIHMSKEAARIFLKVTDVRVERLQDIDNAGIRAEGISIDCPEMLKFNQGMFWDLWDSTIKKQNISKYGWNAKPWVWVYEFERISKPIF